MTNSAWGACKFDKKTRDFLSFFSIELIFGTEIAETMPHINHQQHLRLLFYLKRNQRKTGSLFSSSEIGHLKGCMM